MVGNTPDLLAVTTNIGAALWAANIESQRPVNPVKEMRAGGKSEDSDGGVEVTLSAKKEL